MGPDLTIKTDLFHNMFGIPTGLSGSALGKMIRNVNFYRGVTSYA